MTIKLSRRLSALAALIPAGGFADVGTDHGYIPAFLAQNGYAGRIVAADIKPGPLDTARKTAADALVTDKIEFILCDGLSTVSPEDIACVVIAGMGGETISAILAAAPWTKEQGRRLILQPMSKAEELRRFLLENGYRVTSEQLCRDGIIYEILTATGGQDAPLSPLEEYLGRIEQIKSDPLFSERKDELIKKFSHDIAGLSKSHKSENTQRLQQKSEILSELKELRGDVWQL